MMKVINYFLNGKFMYEVNDKAFLERMNESYFLNFDMKCVYNFLCDELSEDFDICDVVDEINQTSWDNWDYSKSGNLLDNNTISLINKKFGLNLSQEIFGEITYYDCDGNTTDVTYSDALSGIGRLEDDVNVYSYELVCV